MYNEIYEDVKRFLADNDTATKLSPLPFRSRSEHIWRVFNWAKRLIAVSDTGNTWAMRNLKKPRSRE